ncbi:alpha/beta hydrolase [Chitinophaga sedimenti]|uniref:alpha/beta hydrolase n=1 Tax=Chitinophaga sedimenti TaxID=2033606 RepID=UPI0020060EB7|nr:alpha/beta hydrolase [Chitinophaga sedimenti]MCK7555811.1 alpha/beta hydrolase [Chitinophaga sedimenti]
MKRLITYIAASLLLLGHANAQKPTDMEYYTFQLSDKVTRQKVTFTNRYGITLSGDLYLPKNKGTQLLEATAISGPFGAVKEQSSGLYAQQMAERGFATLAFDPSFTGESGGTPRNVASPISTRKISVRRLTSRAYRQR